MPRGVEFLDPFKVADVDRFAIGAGSDEVATRPLAELPLAAAFGAAAALVAGGGGAEVFLGFGDGDRFGVLPVLCVL